MESNEIIDEPDPEFYIVQSGDTLNQIAKDLLGDYKYWSLIYESNRDILSSPEELQVGQKLSIPELEN